MPMYDYTCHACNHEEVDKLVFRTTIVTCPKCGDIMERGFPRTGHFILKGDDWNKDGVCLNKNEDVVKND